jgi:MoxR-like ATPase
MFNIQVSYPSKSEEEQIVKTTTSQATSSVNKVVSAAEVAELQKLVRSVPVSDHLISYAVRLVRQTRPHENGSAEYIRDWVSWGAGPRASQYLILAAKTRAILDGRSAPDPDDVRFAAIPVLRHRLVTSFTAEADGVDSVKIIGQLLEKERA